MLERSAPRGLRGVAVVYLEAEDLAAAFKGLASSDERFDRWFHEHGWHVHGISLEDGMTQPEPVMDLQA